MLKPKYKSSFAICSQAPRAEGIRIGLAPFIYGDPGPVGPSAYAVAVSNGFTGSVDDWLASLVGPAAPLTWGYYRDHWTETPSEAGTTVGGSVLAYVLDGVTRYRFIPAPYDPAQDAFYNTFEARVLSGLIAKRG